MGRRRFSVEDNGAVTDDGRCYQSDGRRWRCPMPSLPNKIYCEHHRSLSRRNGANSQKAVSESELPKPNPILAQDSGTDSDPKRGKLHPNVYPLLRRENDEGLELRSPDQSSDQSVVLAVAAETESKCEKLNCTLNSLVRNKKRRRREKEEESRKEKKRKRSEERETDADPITEDLLRMAVKRQMERREEREEKKRREEREEQKRSEEKIEVRRHLRNGVMAISSPVNNSSNVVQIIDRKIGLEKIGLGFNEGSSFKRRFRSKNAEPEPIGVVKKLGRVLGRSKNTCHGRGKSINCKRKG